MRRHDRSARRRRLPGTPRRLIDAAQQGDREAPTRAAPTLRAARATRRMEAATAAVARARGPRAGGEDRPGRRDPRLAAGARPVPGVRRSLRQQPGAARAPSGLPAQAPAAQPRGLARQRAVGDPTDQRRPRAVAFARHPPGARDSRTDPESRLLVHEQLTSMVRALPSLTKSERTALAGLLDGSSYEQLALIIGGTPKAASQAAYRARRKLAAARPRAA